MSPTKGIMRDSVRQLFPTGRSLTVMLSTISQGMAATALLDELPEVGDGSVVTLPQFSIREYDGAESVNRIQWDGEDGRTVRLVGAGIERTLRWRVQDSTLPELRGVLRVTPSVAGHLIVGDLPPMVGLITSNSANINPAAVAFTGPSRLRRELTQISRGGREQLFAMISLLTPYAREAVHSASMRVHREIHGLDAGDAAARHVIDELEREVVQDDLLYGEKQSDSVAIRLVRRVAATDATVCKSVAAYISVALWSGAETKVRARIGDPHLGRVIRRLARQLRQLDPSAHVDAQSVLDAYKQAYPQQPVGLSRIMDALTAGSSVGSQSIHFHADSGSLLTGAQR